MSEPKQYWVGCGLMLLCGFLVTAYPLTALLGGYIAGTLVTKGTKQ